MSHPTSSAHGSLRNLRPGIASRPCDVRLRCTRGSTLYQSIQCRLSAVTINAYMAEYVKSSAVDVIQWMAGFWPPGSVRPRAIMAVEGSTASTRVTYGAKPRPISPVPHPKSRTTGDSSWMSPSKISYTSVGYGGRAGYASATLWSPNWAPYSGPRPLGFGKLLMLFLMQQDIPRRVWRHL